MKNLNQDKIEALLSLALIVGFVAALFMNVTPISQAETLKAIDGMPAVGRINK